MSCEHVFTKTGLRVHCARCDEDAHTIVARLTRERDEAERETVRRIVAHMRTVYAQNRNAQSFADLIEHGDWKAKP